ncbi:Rieske Fe-S protein [Motilibacter peucedani]|uniref:Cytochrome bc1 complex Rieske iron-sulfur subunit n=1 Tax=Motilibacter peucedani TaxID=598650 RepID=A0A420XSX1_9ACTN|nr:Rieske (2Fe-2S) protein [Motilibacter peucedani]RKS77917.1 Rieske Fe-S protein [Motilibacter peucedani]
MTSERPQPRESAPVPDRRTFLAVAGGGAGLLALAACGGSSSGDRGAAAAPADAASAVPSSPAGSADASATGGPAASGSAAALGNVSDIPVGGSVSAKGPDGKPILLSQPTAGTVVAFSAICTHMGCTVAPGGKTFNCPCHGSVYDAATGKNLSGPAPRPLAEVAVHVVDGQVVAG